jgi:hypothetical protein
MSRLVCCIILALLSQPVLAQGLTTVPNINGGRAVIAFASDSQPSGTGAVAAVPSPMPYAEEIAPSTDYFGPGTGRNVGWWGVPSLFYATADAIFWDRDNDSYHRSMVINANSGNTLLSTRDLDYNFEPGVRATIGWRLPCCRLCSAWEFTYLGVFDWDDSASVVGDNDLSAAGDLGFVVNGFTLAESMRTSYSSKVHSAEANCFKCICNYCCCHYHRRIDWLWGVRYLKLDEDLSLLGNNENVAAALYNVDADNNLYGAQIGGRIRSFHGKWGWEVTKKVGLFANDASQRQYIVDELGVNDVLYRSGSASGDDVAFVTDLNVSLICQVCRSAGLRFGYNLLWVEGIALAPNQLDFNDLANSGNYLRTGDGSFMHGFHVGLEVNW